MTCRRLLIADDDRLILATLGQGLRNAGHEVLEASDGYAAVHLCETAQPELAILDMRMPGMSGVEAARLIRERSKVPFIFLSAYCDHDVVQLAVKEGALGYLVKPVDIPQIIPAIEAALARAADITHLRESEQNLITSLEANRVTSIAVGLVMERYHLDRNMAFEQLRQIARSRQIKVRQIAEELLQATDSLNVLTSSLLTPTPPKKNAAP